MSKPFEKKTYFCLTLDPIYVGTGGYRLGRVDNTIIREPGTNLPKIPGSSIAGVTRSYTAMAIQSEANAYDINYPLDDEGDKKVLNKEKYKKMKYLRPKYKLLNLKEGYIELDKDGNPKIEEDKDGKEIYLSCAGKGGEDGEGHCGEPDCPICIAFGFSKGKSNISFQGLAQFYDARILFFPVNSMIGPVWITSPSVLEFAKVSTDTIKPENWNELINSELSKVESGITKEYFYTQCSQIRDFLNLGWLYLPKTSVTEIDDIKIPPVTQWKIIEGTSSSDKELSEVGINNAILNRIIIVSDRLFSRIVNDNLEVRTSVAIDPATGTAEEGALFSYEAIPRATVMWFDIVYNKPEYFRIKVQEDKRWQEKEIQHGESPGEGWKWVKDNVEKGLQYLEYLGVGGMATKGMGRLKILNLGG